MMDIIAEKLSSPKFMFSLMVAIAAAATVVTVALPLLDADNLRQRMRAVGSEREKLRARERDRLTKSQKVSLRQEQKQLVKNIVDNFNLSQWLNTETSKDQLLMAGFRNRNAEMTFLVFRLFVPVLLFGGTLFYLFAINTMGYNSLTRFGIAIAGAYLGLKAPEFYLDSTIRKRQLSVRRAWPDALDLMLICVESGMSIEQAFRKVAQEIGTQSIPLAEELTLTTAELSYLPDRRMAYENLGNRTGLEIVRGVTTALIQSDRYGTPVGTALRVLAQESRDQRMNDAEKKAAALPPKLTVPMILFFLPVLFVVIMLPAFIEAFKLK